MIRGAIFPPRPRCCRRCSSPPGITLRIIGKWHLGIGAPNTPTERGFSFFHGFLGDMMDDYWTHRRHGYNFMRRNLEEVDPQGHATDIFTEWACEYLEERAKIEGPFFLELAYNAPHGPIQPPPDWVTNVKRREPGLSETQVKYVALIEHLDAGIGKVLATLDRTGLSGNTLVLLTSDNGGVLANGANNGSWRSEKGHMYEGGLRVPGVARWPGVVKPGTRSERMTLTMDIFATACDAAGVQPPLNIDGVSFLTELCGEPSPVRPREFHFVRREGGPLYGGKTIDALRRGDWKLLQDNPFKPLELYDLKSDPKEANDLSTKNRGIFKELSAALQQQIQRAGSVPWQPSAPSP